MFNNEISHYQTPPSSISKIQKISVIMKCITYHKSNTLALDWIRKFLKIVDESFPPTNPLHKRLTRHNLKLSYSCMPNQKAMIKMHKNRLLRAPAARGTLPCQGQGRGTIAPGTPTTSMTSDTRGTDTAQGWIPMSGG